MSQQLLSEDKKNWEFANTDRPAVKRVFGCGQMIAGYPSTSILIWRVEAGLKCAIALIPDRRPLLEA
jgi:hypothetical protein